MPHPLGMNHRGSSGRARRSPGHHEAATATHPLPDRRCDGRDLRIASQPCRPSGRMGRSRQSASREARVGRTGTVQRPRGGRFSPSPLTGQVISRRRLFDRLAARSTVVVLGPAGYGKSLLLSSWLAEAPPDGVVAWLSLDPSDQDPGLLAADLLTALRTPWSGKLGESLERLEEPPLFADHLAFIEALHQTLFDEDAVLTLVLDDVQHLSGSPRALELVDHFIAWAPPSTRVVLASRSMPHLRLQRLRLEGRLELVERHRPGLHARGDRHGRRGLGAGAGTGCRRRAARAEPGLAGSDPLGGAGRALRRPYRPAPAPPR